MAGVISHRLRPLLATFDAVELTTHAILPPRPAAH